MVNDDGLMGLIYRCSGPNCGKLKQSNEEGWWLLWTSDEDSRTAGRLFACGENCAHKLQSTFMSNIVANQRAREMKR